MNLHRTLRPFAAAAMLALAAHAPAALAATTAASPGPQVAWLMAANDTDVDRAFAQGRAENKPVLLYWGAVWCPPCNQLKATLFNRQDFVSLWLKVQGRGAGDQAAWVANRLRPASRSAIRSCGCSSPTCTRRQTSPSATGVLMR